MKWQGAVASDDFAGRNAEQVFTAPGAHGFSWLVAPHDDGTWNLFRRNPAGEIVDYVFDFPTSDAARAEADERDAAYLELDAHPGFVR